MPHLVQMDKRYRKKGLRIIAPEVQGSSKDAIEKLVKEHKIKYPIMKGTTRASSMRGIPHSVVFDSHGELVFEGHPMDEDFEKSVKKALRAMKKDEEEDSAFPKASEPVIAERAWTNTDGKTMVASVLSIEGETVKFKLKNGKETNYPLAQLSEDDQKMIKEAASQSANADE